MTKTERLFLKKAIDKLHDIDEDHLNDENWFTFREVQDILTQLLEGRDK